jgi:hypothetical protein
MLLPYGSPLVNSFLVVFVVVCYCPYPGSGGTDEPLSLLVDGVVMLMRFINVLTLPF